MTSIHTFACGSSGNAALVSRGATHILLDAGISARRIAAALGELGLSPQDLSAICVTHSHSDHISGLATIVKRWDVPILATAPCGRQLSYRVAGLETKLRTIETGGGFPIGEITVTAFPTSHDAPGSCGFRFDALGVLTDSGYVTEEAADTLAGVSLLLLEANHDVDLLQNGPYPYYLKERILSGQGHLSNETAAAFAVAMARQGIFFIPLVAILSLTLGVLGIQMTQAVSDLFTLACAIPLQRKVLRALAAAPEAISA